MNRQDTHTHSKLACLLVPAVGCDDIDGEGIVETAVVTVVLCGDVLLKHVAAIIIKQLLKQHRIVWLLNLLLCQYSQILFHLHKCVQQIM